MNIAITSAPWRKKHIEQKRALEQKHMSLSDHYNIIRFVILPLLLAVAVITLPLLVLFRSSARQTTDHAWLFIIVFGLLGGISGLCTGASRESVVGSVLPSLLTLMTALCGYAFTKDGLAKMRSVLPFSLIALLLAAVYCAFVGSKIRFENELYSAKEQRNLLYYERVDLETAKAIQLKALGVAVSDIEIKPSDNVSEPVKPSLPIPGNTNK